MAVFQAEPNMDAIEQFLLTHGEGDGLDLVHLSCLPAAGAPSTAACQRPAQGVAAAAENFRKPCGGWDNNPNRERHGLRLLSGSGRLSGFSKAAARPLRILQSLKRLETPDHMEQSPQPPVGSTNPPPVPWCCSIICTCPSIPKSAIGSVPSYIRRAASLPSPEHPCPTC